MKQLLIFIAIITCSVTLHAQASYTVTDSMPVVTNGLQIGYNITNQSEKEVGNKGNFSRYVIVFYVTNTTPEAKIIFHKPGWNLFNSDVSPNLVQFDCINATGARLTAKMATVQARQCNVMAAVDDKDCGSNSTKKNQRMVDIGYWIQPGETISNKQIVIVPLGERPHVRATLLLNSNSMMGSSISAATPGMSSNNNSYNNQSYANAAVYYTIKNVWKSTYLYAQSGTAICGPIASGGSTAQWQLIPIAGTNNYLLQNRWKKNFLNDGVGNNSMLSLDNQSLYSMWVLEPIDNNGTYKIKNVGDNTYLNIETGPLRASWIQNDAWSARWVLEPVNN